jgi:putative oxidoreductase
VALAFLDKLRPLSLLLLRFGFGVVFIYHGYPKLFSRPEFYQQAFERLGLPPGLSYAAGIIELFGGALLLVGLFTRAAALLLAAEFLFAMWKVHLREGLLAVPEYEFALLVVGAALVLASTGAGPVSLDYAIFRQKA